jgi:hypothetical protein
MLKKQATIAITQEAEIVINGIIISRFPVVAYKCSYQKQQCAAWLVKIGNNCIRDMIGITGGNQ